MPLIKKRSVLGMASVMAGHCDTKFLTSRVTCKSRVLDKRLRVWLVAASTTVKAGVAVKAEQFKHSERALAG